MDEDRDEALALEEAKRVLWTHREGVLHFDGQTAPVKFVTDPESGRLVLSVPVAVFFAAEHVLWTPDEGDEALQLLVSPEEAGESALTDRWQAYHGEPDHVRWGVFWIDSARHGPWVFDGEALMEPNPLAPEEPALCRELNADREALSHLCEGHAGVAVPEPVCVGLDPRGLHVRARFGVVRVPFGEMCADPTAARREIARLRADR